MDVSRSRTLFLCFALVLVAVVAAATVFFPARTAAQAPLKYVALGDSFTSSGSLVGPGIGMDLGTFGSSGDGACLKSTDGYPRQLAAMTGWQLTDVSCRGARVPLMYQHTPQYGAPQLDAVTADTDVVSVQVGGNDTDVMQLFRSCIFSADCTHLEPAWADRVPQVAPGLSRLISDMRARAPRAQIVMVGYLQPFPYRSCVNMAPFTAVNQAFFRRHIERLNSMLRGVAREQGVALVADTTPPGHSACDPDRWVSFLGVDANAVPLHPTHSGHTAMAQMIRAAVR